MRFSLPGGLPAAGDPFPISFPFFLMGKMKRLYTIGQELQSYMQSQQLVPPSSEELREMQQQYLQLLRLTKKQHQIQPHGDQESLC